MAVISLILYSILFICVTDLKGEHVPSENPTNWQTAKSTCESNGGTLLQQDFNLDGHDIDGPVWLDGVETLSQWMINAGCYRYSATEVKGHAVVHGSNNAVSCAKFCGNGLPIGLLEDTCYCLKPDFNLQKASNTICTIICTGDSRTLCGGVRVSFDEYVTVYDCSHEIQNADVTGNGECLAVEIKSKSKKYMAQTCNNMLPVLCQNETTGHVEEYDTKTDWYGASQTCKSNNLLLANDQFINMKVKNNQVYWIGYFRKSFSIWKPTVDVKNPIGCYLFENGEIKVTSCSELNHFICVKEKALVSLTSSSHVPLTTRQPEKQKDEEDDDINLPVIIGASVGGVLILLVFVVAAVIVIVCKRRRTKRETLNTPPVREPTNEQEAALSYMEPGPDPKSKRTNTYCEPEKLEPPAKPVQRMNDDEYDHLLLNGQRVSFNVDDGNLYDVSGTDTYGISHIDEAHKPQTSAADDTYDHTTNVLQ